MISSDARKKFEAPQPGQPRNSRKYGAAQWHSDIQFEEYPADYTSLRLVKVPKTGGDTLWASGYELYDRFSTVYQKFFVSLSAVYSGEGFLQLVKAGKATLYDKPRGNPNNVGDNLTAIHPVVRTNPVTGWKSIYAVGPFPKQIVELSKEESDGVLKLLKDAVVEQHDLQVRFKWKNENDIGEYCLRCDDEYMVTEPGVV